MHVSEMIDLSVRIVVYALQRCLADVHCVPPLQAVAKHVQLTIMGMNMLQDRYRSTRVFGRAGKQAEVLNILLEDVLQGHPISDRKLKEVLGHTPIQVSPCTQPHCLCCQYHGLGTWFWSSYAGKYTARVSHCGFLVLQVASGAILGVIVACFVPSPTQLPVV